MTMKQDGTQGKGELEWGTERVKTLRVLMQAMNGAMASAYHREDEAALMRIATYYSARLLNLAVIEAAHPPKGSR